MNINLRFVQHFKNTRIQPVKMLIFDNLRRACNISSISELVELTKLTAMKGISQSLIRISKTGEIQT